MSQTVAVLERTQEFVNSLLFSAAAAHSKAATHPRPHESCVTANHLRVRRSAVGYCCPRRRRRNLGSGCGRIIKPLRGGIWSPVKNSVSAKLSWAARPRAIRILSHKNLNQARRRRKL